MGNTLLTLLKRMLILWMGYFISDSLTFLVILINIKSVRDITLPVKKTFFSFSSSVPVSYFLNCFYESRERVQLITPDRSIYVFFFALQ